MKYILRKDNKFVKVKISYLLFPHVNPYLHMYLQLNSATNLNKT